MEKPFSTDITFWHAYKNKRRFYPRSFDFFLKVMGHIPRDMIKPQAEAFRNIFSGYSKIVFGSQPDWLKSLPPILTPRHVNTYAYP